jgi:hypothetical protein
MTRFFVGMEVMGDEWRVEGKRRNKRDSSAVWADIIAGAMMKEKAPANFARNDTFFCWGGEGGRWNGGRREGARQDKG